jgi:hypothetical protein
MITISLISEILSLYKKHGWKVSRVLLSREIKDSLDSESFSNLFGGIEIIEHELNAVWFSRPSKHGKIAWELRHLSEQPFAIFELFDENEDKELIKETLHNSENRLKIHASK